MSTALMEKPSEAVALPKDQIDLIRRTVANGATNDELALFLYDCQRRGIHPLDKLLHFTKRGGRYTPVTSIDFMRAQAAATGEMAGSDDIRFSYIVMAEEDKRRPENVPVEATATVYRLTDGQRFAYTATARWAEYCPDNAPMWKRMPHTMLGKCAEALALRKAFPQQLAGLYSREEMDQADEPKGYIVTAPAPLLREREKPAAATVENRGTSETGVTRVLVAGNEHAKDGDPVYIDALTIQRVERKSTKNQNVTKFVVVLSDGREVTTIKDQLGSLAEQCAQDGDAVTVETKTTKWGEDLIALHRAMPELQLNRDLHAHDGGPDPDEPLPF